MLLNSMYFASLSALTQALGGERCFLLRVNAVVCLPARTPLTLSSPFPQQNLGLSQEIARTWHIYICVLFLKQSYQGKKWGIYFSPDRV